MITLSLLAAAALSSTPPAANGPNAQPSPAPPVVESKGPPDSAFHYNYVDGALVFGDFYGVRGDLSLHLDGQWIALGRAEYLTDDEGNADVDVILLSGGAGYVHTVQDNLDLIGSAELEWGHVEVDNPGGGGSDDDLGLRLRGGLRFQANDEFELAGGLSFSTIFDEDLGLDFRALYAFSEKLSGFVGIDLRDDTFASVGVRYNL